MLLPYKDHRCPMKLSLQGLTKYKHENVSRPVKTRNICKALH